MKISQEAFGELMKEHVAPRLRELGFKGSGSSYSLANKVNYILLGFQKSVRNSKASSKFTINLTVVKKQEWSQQRAIKSYLPEKPSPNYKYDMAAWHSRIGKLLPGGEDKWWEITTDSNLEAMSAELVSVIENYALPAINEQLA